MNPIDYCKLGGKFALKVNGSYGYRMHVQDYEFFSTLKILVGSYVRIFSNHL